MTVIIEDFEFGYSSLTMLFIVNPSIPCRPAKSSGIWVFVEGAETGSANPDKDCSDVSNIPTPSSGKPKSSAIITAAFSPTVKAEL